MQSVTSQVVAGTEYTVKAAVDGKPTTIVFQRLPGNKQHPGKSPNINDNGNLRDLFHVVSIVPHPCDSYVAAELVDKEPATPYTYGLQMPAVMHYTKSLISEEERAEIPSDFDWRDHITGGHTAKAAQVQNQGSCGSCWAFAASTVLSYGLNIKSEGRYDVQPSPQIGMSCRLMTLPLSNHFRFHPTRRVCTAGMCATRPPGGSCSATLLGRTQQW